MTRRKVVTVETEESLIRLCFEIGARASALVEWDDDLLVLKVANHYTTIMS
jgi:predicted nucleic acid-binding protein